MIRYVLLAIVFIAQPALAQQDDEVTYSRNGTRIEVRGGYETPTVSRGSFYSLGHAPTIGVEIGHDIAVGRRVSLGVFANYEYARTSVCGSTGLCTGVDASAQVGGRVGLNLGNRAQAYAKAGYGWSRLYASVGGDEISSQLGGPMGAIGVDYNLTRRAYVGLEADYTDLGNVGGVDIARRHVAVTAGTRF